MKLKAIIVTVAVVAVGVGTTVAITQSTDKEEPTPPVNVEQSTENIPSTVPETELDTEATTEPILESTTKDETTTASKLNLLTENEIKEKVLYASQLQVDWLGYGWAVRYDFDSVITGQYDMPYYQVIPTRFATLNDLEKELQNCFAEYVYKEVLEHNYMQKDGKWYVICTIGQGANYGLKYADLNIISNTENKCEFTITCHYHDVNEKETIKYTLELVSGKWIFTEFGGPFIWRSDETFKWM
ncbi:MAG: hypothetical protein IJA80_02780 [Clostridia bacterium]|nr:hypothetical protein [Clostridia bacterium]